MLSNAQQKYVQSLHQKKFRKLHNAFIVEGRKNVTELAASDYTILKIFATTPEGNTDSFVRKGVEIISVSANELSKISTLKTSDGVLAVVQQKTNVAIPANGGELVLVLDGVNDPGNLGTIIRTADWYGIRQLICSENTVELYNPKVIMATMGSFTRISVSYVHLPDFFTEHPSQRVFGAFLDGASVHATHGFSGGYLVMGSESHGISDNLRPFITQKITIPRFGGAESLNVAISTAILLDNFAKLK